VAEPYVPIAEYTASNALLTELEVATDASETNADALSAATASALASKNTADAVVAQKFDLLFLVGA
jgi:hypothetical protein